jgi:hypothetical protein
MGCGAIDGSKSRRTTCNNSDWRNDEPLAETPEDCQAKHGICESR